MPAMVKTLTRTVTAAGRAIGSGFANGMAQAVSVRGAATVHRAPAIRSSAEALGDDWKKLGGDMHRAVGRAAPSGARK
jgi:hypothetical protein